MKRVRIPTDRFRFAYHRLLRVRCWLGLLILVHVSVLLALQASIWDGVYCDVARGDAASFPSRGGGNKREFHGNNNHNHRQGRPTSGVGILICLNLPYIQALAFFMRKLPL